MACPPDGYVPPCSPPPTKVETFDCYIKTTTYTCEQHGPFPCATYTNPCAGLHGIPLIDCLLNHPGPPPPPTYTTYYTNKVVAHTTYEYLDCPSDCTYEQPPPLETDNEHRRDLPATGTGGSGFKKNHPGCNCCGRVLVWDLGHYFESFPNPDPDPGVHGYHFQDWTLLKQWLEAEGIRVDFVSGGVRQGDGWLNNLDFDPYSEPAVKSDGTGYWTGNIYDYNLVIWPYPAEEFDLDGESEPCPFCRIDELADVFVLYLTTYPGVPDHPYGGLPEWWEDVELGRWQGRLLWITEGISELAPDATIGLASAVFLNTLFAAHGMTVNDIAMYRHGTDDGVLSDFDLELDIVQNFIANKGKDQEELVVSEFPSPFIHEDIAGDNSGGISRLVTEVTGGVDVLTTAGTDYSLVDNPPWCENSEYDDSNKFGDFTVIARNTITKMSGEPPVEALVDYIISTTASIVPRETHSEVQQDSLRAFYLNLATVPVRA